MEDRQSANPGRVKITLDDGTVMFGIIERADEPTVAGTPLNKNTLFNSKNSERYVSQLPSEAFELLGKVWGTYNLTADGWSEAVDADGYYTQQIAVNGMRKEYYPGIIQTFSSSEAKDEEKSAFGLIDIFESVDGYIIAKAVDAPSVTVQFILEGA